MSRNASGVYSLPLPQVVPGTLITADWANTTMADIAQALTDSLDREGRGGMNAPIRVAGGSAIQPSYSFTGATSTGMYSDNPDELNFAVTGVPVLQITPLGMNLAGDLGVVGNLGVAGNIDVTGLLTLTGVLAVDGDIAITGDFGADGNGVFGGNLEAGTGIGADPVSIHLGAARTADGASYIDFVTATGSPDYNLRLLRNAGTDGSTEFRHTGTGPMNYISQGSGPLQFFVNELEQFSLTSNGATNIGNPDASGAWRAVFWPQTVTEVAWSMASITAGWLAWNAAPATDNPGANTLEISSGSALRQRKDGTSEYPIHIFRNKVLSAAQHPIGAILFDAFRDVLDPSYVGGMWCESTSPAGNVPVLKFGAQQNGPNTLPTGGALMQLQYDGHWQLSSNGGGYASVYSGVNNNTKPSYMARAVGGAGDEMWGFQVTIQSGEPTVYRMAWAATVSSISPGYPQHIYKFFLNQYNEFNSTSAQVLGTNGQWQFAVATGIISSAHLKSNWALETGGLVDGLAAIVDVGSFDITLGDPSPAIAAAAALLPGEHPDFPQGRPAIIARPARPPVTVRQVGTTAEAIEAIMPAAVTEAGGGVKAIAYGNAALVAAIALAKRIKAIEAFVGL